jgi:hypothetical protein
MTLDISLHYLQAMTWIKTGSNPGWTIFEEKRQKLERKIATDSVSNPMLDMIAYADAPGSI